jgi:hypothetical protein
MRLGGAIFRYLQPLFLTGLFACGEPTMLARSAEGSSQPQDDWSDVKTTPASTPPATQAEKTIEIHKGVLLLGSKVESTTTTGVNELFGIETRNGTVTVENVASMVDHRIVQVLLFDRGQARKVGVTFEQKEEVHIMNGRERRKASPVSGKSYVIELTDAGPKVSAPDGAAVPEKEASVVAAGYRNPSALLQAIPEGRVPVGKPLPALGEALKEDTRQGFEGARVQFGKVSVTPVGTRDVAGTSTLVFAVVLQMGVEKEDSRLRMNMTGELLLRGDNGWPVGMDASGPVASDASVNGVGVHGQGTARFKTVYVYP